ncbi:MAG TPA: CoA-transferase [Candidatus Eisenbacteria bacterium]|nr:CoA-transferase [Candidatus Eisenbacteria bacterium]
MTAPLAPRERMVLRAAREIREGETVFVGTRLPLLAYLVAKATHAPSAVALYENGLIREEAARELLFTMGDPPNILDATLAGTTLDVMGLMAAGRVDLGFLGAAEVDRYGNLNSTEGVDAEGRPTRLPGSGGAADILSLARRSVILVPHEKRRLVERVRFRTSPGRGDGPGWRARAGLPSGGPSAIITTHAVFRFDHVLEEAYLYEVFPGVTVDHVLVGMSWEPRIAQPIGMTRFFTDEEVAALRRIDPEGFWTGATPATKAGAPSTEGVP